MKLSDGLHGREEEINLTLTKALKHIDAYEFSDVKFLKEYQLAVIQYVEAVLSGIFDGIALALNVNPNILHKSIRIPYDLIEKASRGEYVEEGLIIKSILYQNLKDKYKKAQDRFKKYGLGRNRKGSIKPLKINGKVFKNYETGNPMTEVELNQLSRDLTAYLTDNIGSLEEEVVTKSAILGKMMQSAEWDRKEALGQNKHYKIKGWSWDELSNNFGGVPVDYDQARKQLGGFSKQETDAIKFAEANAGENLSIRNGKMKNQIVDIVRKNVVGGLRDGLSQREVAQRLFWIDKEDALGKEYKDSTAEELTRNWRRVALTETSSAFNNGYMVAQDEANRKDDPEKKTYFVFSGSVNPKEPPDDACNKYIGKIFLFVDKRRTSEDISNDKYATLCTWAGKSNVGRRAVNWWGCIPMHPHCTHRWEAIDPEIEQWNEEDGMVQDKRLEGFFDEVNV